MEPITVDVTVKADIDAVWAAWVTPEDIEHWNAASDDWHTPRAEVDLREGGEFLFRMEAKDGSYGFDFRGMYQKIIPLRLIEYNMEDGRHVRIEFVPAADGVKVTETFDPEETNPVPMQKKGWQSILNNFAKYVESR
ncbi:MAG: hypothetical protein AMJ68_09095 [Acidithiobacillales bacterium SG8_45]|jgi:uncharacterized protein YndB with AHSA1/START domain|nr:MAG: hypothetical protein AMJ68_09095 [Acidithiobacillales bacterium SG8_45]